MHKDYKKQLSDDLLKLQEAESSFYILDTNIAGKVADIKLICSQLKPDAVFVDGAYLLIADSRYGKYEKVGEVCRELKRLATDCNIPVIASWQLNRESKKAKSLGIEHIAGSDEIGQLSSVVLGLLEEDSIATAKRKMIDILKGRSGEKGIFYTNWCFKTMSFSEVMPDYSMDLI